MPPLLFSARYKQRRWILQLLPGQDRLYTILGQWDEDAKIFYPMDYLPLETIDRLNAYLKARVK